MESLTSIQKLDKVLELFATSPSISDNLSMLESEVDVKLKKEMKVEIRWEEIMRILNKLVKEEYLEKESNNQGGMLYRITFDGMLFYSQGGYRQKIEDEILERTRLKNQNRIGKWSSIGVAVGTIGLLLWEITKVLWHHKYIFQCH
jgi:hypothetical protein